MAKKLTLQEKLIRSAFALASEQPWHRISLSDIAKHAKVPLTDTLALYTDKNGILDSVIAEVTNKATAECDSFTDEDTIRDRLFALLMARLDAMAPYRAGGASILRSITRDPVSFICRLPHVMAAMAQMLEAAGVDSSGLCGAVRTKALALVFATTVRTWLHDESEDLAPTMAALDKALGRADMLAQQFWPKPKTP